MPAATQKRIKTGDYVIFRRQTYQTGVLIQHLGRVTEVDQNTGAVKALFYMDGRYPNITIDKPKELDVLSQRELRTGSFPDWIEEAENMCLIYHEYLALRIRRSDK